MNVRTLLAPLSSPVLAGSLLRTHAPQIVAALAALLVGVQIAAAISRYAGGAELPPVSARESGYQPPDAGAQRARVDLASLVGAHLFGEAASSGDAASAPQTTLALVLAGVLASDDPKAGFAIVGESAASARFFPVGASLPGGARLNAVYPDRIVIDRGGTLESLGLPRRSLATAPQPVGLAPVEESRATMLSQRVRDMAQQNPNALANVLRAQQVMAGGKQRGFRVYPGANPAAFSRLGLRPGDLITAINGTALDDPSRGDEVMRNLSSAPEVRVTLMRNGRQSDLVLDMTRLASEVDQIVSTEGMATVDQAAPVPPPQ